MKKNNISIGFVVLHYLTTEETKKAIEAIKEHIDVEDYQIVIVDNASPNNSYEELKEYIGHDEKIDILKNEDNSGFAKGNNIGFRFLRDHYHPKFIININNDVYIESDNIYEAIKVEYEKSHFAVAGPRICGPDNDVAGRPIRVIPTITSCNFWIREMRERLFWMRFHLYEKVCPFLRKRVYNKLHIFKRPVFIEAGICEGERDGFHKEYDVGIHGCCFIFSPAYIEKYDGLNEETFMYGEERILFTQMLCNRERTVYMPELVVFHEGAKSTTEAKRNIKQNKKLIQWTEADLKSYLITKRLLVDFKNNNGIEVHEDWKNNN